MIKKNEILDLKLIISERKLTTIVFDLTRSDIQTFKDCNIRTPLVN